MVETMALIEDTVGVAPTEKIEFMVCGGGVTPTVDGVKVPVVSGLRISIVNDTVEVTVDEVSPSISKGGATSPNVGISGSMYGKGGGNTLFLLGDGRGGG